MNSMKEGTPEVVIGSVIELGDQQDRRAELERSRRIRAGTGEVALRTALDTRPQQDLRRLEVQLFQKGEFALLGQTTKLQAALRAKQASAAEILHAVEQVVAEHLPAHLEEPEGNITPIGVMKYDSHPAPEIPQDESSRDRVIPLHRS